MSTSTIIGEEGGVEWELESARKLYVAALMSGNTEMQSIASLRHSEALANLAYAKLMPSLLRTHSVIVEPMIQATDGLRLDVRTLAAETATRLGKLENTQTDLHEGYAQVVERLERKRHELDDITRRLLALESFRVEVERILSERPSQRRAEHQEILLRITQLLTRDSSQSEQSDVGLE